VFRKVPTELTSSDQRWSQSTASDHQGKRFVRLFQVLFPLDGQPVCFPLNKMADPVSVDNDIFCNNEISDTRRCQGSSAMLAVSAESHSIFFK
jgi:hypothetical protein